MLNVLSTKTLTAPTTKKRQSAISPNPTTREDQMDLKKLYSKKNYQKCVNSETFNIFHLNSVTKLKISNKNSFVCLTTFNETL